MIAKIGRLQGGAIRLGTKPQAKILFASRRSVLYDQPGQASPSQEAPPVSSAVRAQPKMKFAHAEKS